MTPEDIAKLPMAAWLEESIKTLVALKPESCAIVGRAANGTVFTGYWNAEAEEKAAFAYNITSDAVLDLIVNNQEYIRHKWEEQEDQEDQENQEEGPDR